MLVPMVKVAIVGHRRQLDPVAALLHDLAVLHVLDFSEAPELEASPLPPEPEQQTREEALRAMRARVDALWSLDLQVHAANARPAPADRTCPSPFELDGELRELLPRVEALSQKLAELDHQIESLPRHLASLEQLVPLAPDVEMEGYETVALMIARQHADLLEVLRAELDEMVDKHYELRSKLVTSDTLGALLAFPRAASAQVHGLLGSGQVSRVRLPSAFEGLSFEDSVGRMRERLTELPEERGALRESIAELIPGVDWAAVRARIDAQLEQLALRRRLGASEHAFVMVGWIPEPAQAALVEALAERVGPEVMLEPLAPADDDVPPVLLHNPRVARPFETLVGIYGVPDPRGVDPTLMMSVFMPLFFGMMLGDVGYGIVLFIIATVLGRQEGRLKGSPVMRDIARVLTLGAVWAVIWGVLFGEVFGDLGEKYWGIHAVWISRTEAHAVGPLLVFSLGVGAAHVTLGLLIGIWQAVRHKQRSELAERGGMLLGLTGLFVLLTVVAGLLPAGLMTPSIAALVVGTVVLGTSKGLLGILMGPLEIIGGVGNVLSYLRIAAIGLASVYLARVANELAVMAPAVLGVVVAVLLHALNIALGAFSPTIQALRLHYVEFFDKFYKPGAVVYRPFGATAAPQASPH